MKSAADMISTMLVLCVLVMLSDTKCPETCNCIKTTGGYNITCYGPNNWSNATSFPRDIINFNLSHTEINDELLALLLHNQTAIKSLFLKDTDMSRLNRKLFSSLHNLQELQLLQADSIKLIDEGVFSELTSLRKIRVSEINKIPFNTMLSAMLQSPSRSIDTFIMDTQGLNTHQERPIMTKQIFRRLASKPITTLVLTNDVIQMVVKAPSIYMKSYTCIILQGNIITGEAEAITQMWNLPKIRYLDLSYQGKYMKPNIPHLNAVCEEPLSRKTEVWTLDPVIVNKTKFLINKICGHHYVTNVSSSLRYIFFRNFFTGVTTSSAGACIPPNNRIRYLDLSNNNVAFTRPILGLMRLQFLNFQNCIFSSLSYHTFAHFPSLTTLLLGGNSLGPWFKEGNATFALHKLNKFKSLDLAHNGIMYLSNVDIQFLMGIQYINLSRNSITEKSLDNHFKANFNFLNISKNKLTFLPKKFRQSIDSTSKASHNAPFIDASNNHFICSCDYLDSMNWLFHKREYFYYFTSYTCEMNAKQIPLNENTLKELKYSCKTNKTNIIVGSVLGILAIVTMVGLTYRHRNQLNYYICFLSYIKWKKYSLKSQNYEQLRDKLDFDVFIIHSGIDSEFVTDTIKPQLEKRHLALCIANEQFIAGQSIIGSILTAIESCRCVLLVVSENFVSSAWCEQEMTMSLAMRKKVVVLSLDNPPRRRMPPALIYLYQKQTRQIYPRDKDGENVHLKFWDNLEKALRNTMKTSNV